MSNKFCRLLSNGYKINIQNNQLLWSPCCFYTKKVPLLNVDAFQKEIQYTSNATGWLPECRTCELMEKSGEQTLSPRLISFKRVPEEFNDQDCVSLEISFDTKCNAACLSCGSYCSSTWEKYNRKHNLPNYNPQTLSADYFLHQLITTVDLSKLRNIYIMGGEPFYSDTQLKLLRHLETIHPELDKITLRYQTNGSIIPSNEIIELWSKFKGVEISLSIDGVEDKFNYLRWPLKWHRIERTINHLIKVPNVLFHINATVGPLNILYFQEIEDWAYSIIPRDRFLFPDKPVRPNRCFQPFDLTLTTAELRNEVIARYGAEHRVSKVLEHLEVNNNYYDMLKYLAQHDKIRKSNWQETFPDAAKYYPKYFGV